MWVVHLSTDPNHPLDSSTNTFMLNGEGWDGSLNIYSGGKTPKEYGLGNIIEWLRKRNVPNVKFFTLYSDEAIIIP